MVVWLASSVIVTLSATVVGRSLTDVTVTVTTAWSTVIAPVEESVERTSYVMYSVP